MSSTWSRVSMAGPTITAISHSRHCCNLCKGTNLTRIDPVTKEIVPLFNSRRDCWLDRFGFRGPVIEGITTVGRTTVKLLSMNDTRRIVKDRHRVHVLPDCPRD
jgi:hypothetical protein